MELKDTVSMMLSDDYKQRLIAEYHQTKERYEKLHKMIVKIEACTRKCFEPKYSISLLREQEDCMRRYLHCLEIRAEIDGINLDVESMPY